MALYNTYYYNETIRKYVIAFGHIFTNIFVSRGDAITGELQREVVPVTYSAKEKFVQRLNQDYTDKQRIALKLPRIGFEVIGYQYAPERKTSTRYRVEGRDLDDNGLFAFQYNPVPYDIDFDVSIITKSQEEGLQIIEQILPFFAPDYVISMKLSAVDSNRQDIAVSLLSVASDDTFSGQFDDRRTIMWSLSFKLKGFVYGPPRTGKRILRVITNTISVDNIPQVVPAVLAGGIAITGVWESNVFEGLDDVTGELVSSGEVVLGEGVSYAFPKNTEFSTTLNIKNEAGTILDFSGGTLTATFKKTFSSDTLHPISVAYDVGTKDITLSVLAATTTTLTNGIYIFDIYYDDGTSITGVLQGTFNITG
jgi:hypothetical protein